MSEKELSPRDVRKRLKHISQGLANHTINDAERRWLIQALAAIAGGEDANVALGVKNGKGQKDSDASARAEYSKIFQWVAGAMSKDLGHGYTLDQALEVAIVEFKYPRDLAYLREKWYDYEHMQSPLRSWSDIDSPFNP